MNNTDEGLEDQGKELLDRMRYANFRKRDVTAYELRLMADYFRHIADVIDHERLCFRGNQPLVEQFERVWLAFQDITGRCGTATGSQVSDIIGATNPYDTIGILSALGETQIRRLRARGTSFLGLLLGRSDVEVLGVTPDRLLAVKVALKRLAPVIQDLADTIEDLDRDDEEFYSDLGDARAHYDPSLIDKNRLLALINIARVEINRIPDQGENNAILQRLDRIESCLKKRKVPWKTILAATLVLWGILADLKTLSPVTYDRAADAVMQMVQVLHADGQVQSSRRQLFDGRTKDENEPDRPRETALLTERPSRREERNGDGSTE